MNQVFKLTQSKPFPLFLIFLLVSLPLWAHGFSLRFLNASVVSYPCSNFYPHPEHFPNYSPLNWIIPCWSSLKTWLQKKKKTWLQILWHAIHRKVGIYVIFPWVWRASDCLCLTIETAEVKPRDFWGQVVKRRAASTFPRTPALGNINKIQLRTV